MIKRTNKILTLSAIAAAAAFSSASATVLLDSAANFTTDPDPDTIVRQSSWTFANATDLGGFDPTSSDKLVLAFSGENTGTITATYGGAAFTQIEYGNGARFAGIYYLDGPVTNGDLVINTSSGSANGVGGSLFALSGTAAGFGVSNLSAGGSTTISPAAGSLVVAVATKNQGTPPEAQGDLTLQFASGSGSSAVGTGYQSITAAGSISPTFNNSPDYVAATEFTAVPEPSAFALLAGCFGLTWVMLRRRR